MIKNKLNYLISFFSFIGYFAGLTLIIFSGFIGLSRYYSIPLRIILSLLMVFLAIKLRFTYNSKNRLNLSMFLAFWILYFLAIGKAMLGSTAGFHISTFEYFTYSLIYGIIPFLFFLLKRGDNTLNIFKNALIASGLILAVITYLLYSRFLFSGVGRLSMVVYSEGSDFAVISPLALSYASSLVITICLYYLLFTKLSKKIIIYYLIVIIVSMAPFFLGASRGSVMAILLSFVLIIYFQGSLKTKIRSFVFFLLLAIGIIYVAELIGSPVISRVLSISEDIEMGNSSTERLSMWKSAWLQFIKSPVFGDSIQSKIPPHPHNIILEVLMSVGLLGFIPFIFLLISAIRKSIRIIKYSPEHVWIFILFFQGLIKNSFSGTVYSAIFFWSGIALVFSIKSPIKSSNKYIITNQ